jgi:hypothetical protein
MNLSRSGDHDQAVSLFRRAATTQPDFWYSWHNLGLTLTKQGDFAAAAHAYGESLKLLYSMTEQQPVDKLLRRTLKSIQEAHELATLPNVLANEQWQYCLREPENWPSSGHADVEWRRGTAPFGTSYFHPRTAWNSPEIWLRKAFSLPDSGGSQSLIIVFRAVAQVRIHVNGRLVTEERLTNDEPYCVHLDRTANSDLRAGENMLAVHAAAIHQQRRIEVALHVGNRSIARQRCDQQLGQVIEHLQNLGPDNSDAVADKEIREIVESIMAHKKAHLE